jgi:predicted enzyme related to lactoylglutathione lyase
MELQLLVNIDVGELEPGIRFYEEAVGLRLARRLFDGTVAEMTGASANVYLLAKPQGSSPTAMPSQLRDYVRHWTPVHLDFVVADLDAAVDRAIRAGATAERPIKAHPWGCIAMMSDPFGNGFCLVQWIGDGYRDTQGGTEHV